MVRWFVVLGSAAAMHICGLVSAHAQEFKPFTEVKSVCPQCPTKYSTIELSGGEEIQANIIAENPTFYVLEKFNEQRAVGKDKVKEVKRSTEKRTDAALFADQILLKNGDVLAGQINEIVTATGYYKMMIGDLMHFVSREQVRLVYKGGREEYRAK
jgi:hypothetical protein